MSACDVSAWSTWTTCTLTCGGARARSRSVVTHATGGYVALRLRRWQCNDSPCPVDCIQSAWSAWTACSLTCGSGSQSRARTVTLAARRRGAHSCRPTVGDSPCPVDCVTTEWTDWSTAGDAVAAHTISKGDDAVQHGGTAYPIWSSRELVVQGCRCTAMCLHGAPGRQYVTCWQTRSLGRDACGARWLRLPFLEEMAMQ